MSDHHKTQSTTSNQTHCQNWHKKLILQMQIQTVVQTKQKKNEKIVMPMMIEL